MSNSKKRNVRFMLIVILFWFSQYIYVPYQTVFLNTKSVSQNIIGMIIGSYGLAQLLLRIPTGIIADKGYNHKKIISIGIFLAGFASIIRIIFPNGTGFLIANIVSGIASATWISFMVYYLNKFKAEEKFKATSQLIMANNTGMLLGFISSSLLFKTYGMAFICLLGFLSGLVGCFISFTITSETNSPNNLYFRSKDILYLLKNKNLLIYGSLALVQQGIQMSTTMSFTTQMIQKHGASDFIIGFSTIFYMSCAVIFAKIGTLPIMNKWNKSSLIVLSFCLVGFYCLLVPIVQNVSLILFLQIIPGFSTGILFSILTSEAIKKVPEHLNSTGMGIYQAIYAIGMTIFPMVTGWINMSYSMKKAFFSLAFLSFIISLTSYLFFRNTDYRVNGNMIKDKK